MKASDAMVPGLPRLRDRRHLLLFVSTVALIWATVTAVAPMSPTQPVAQLDPGWQLATAHAAAAHLQFGTEFIFTYGPWSEIVTKLYWPGEYIGTLLLAGLYATSWCVALLRLLPRWSCRLAAAFVLLAAPAGAEALILLYPLAAVTAMPRRIDRASCWAVAAVLGAGLGILPLVKVSCFTVVGAAIAIAALRAWRTGLVAAGVAVATFAAAWIAAGQSLSGVWAYMHASLIVIAGYSDAMRLDATPVGRGFLPLAVSLLIAFALQVTMWRRERDWAWLAMGVLTLAVVAKEAAVRIDWQHLDRALLPLVAVAGYVAIGGSRRVRVMAGILVVVQAAAFALSASTTVALASTGDTIVAGLASPIDLAHNLARPGRLTRAHDAALETIKAQQPALPQLTGTVDLYPWNVAIVAANGYLWDPRPIPQSYSAYTPALARVDAAHLTGPSAPTNVLWTSAPIDGRLPALDDDESWLPLLSRYRFTETAGSYDVLQRRAKPADLPISRATILRTQLGQWVDLPHYPVGSGLWVTYQIHPSAWGSLAAALWRPPTVTLTLRLSTGAVETRRIVPSMSGTHLLLSPYVASAGDFEKLYVGGSGLPVVEAVRIGVIGGQPAFDRDVSWTVSTLKLPAG